MKKTVHKFTTVILSVCLLLSLIPIQGIFTVDASTSDSGKITDTITWNYNAGTLTISGSGEMPNYKTENNYYTGITSNVPWCDYLNTISKVSITGTIINIGDFAFSDCPSLTTISMPSTISVIGSNSFARCSNLKSISLPSSLNKIGSSAFIGCSSIEKITVPDTVTSVGNSAFQACSNLKNVKLSSSLTQIAGSMFYGCNKLYDISIPSSVTEINTWAFYNCSSLSMINIPNAVTKIYDEAFSNCTSLSEMDIPHSVTNIYSRVFQNCTSLRKITINNRAISFSSDVFKNCGKLIVYSYTDSTTEKYCEENGYAFSALDASSSKLSIKSFEIDKISGQKIGTKITLSAKATGGTSPYKYLFYCKDADGKEKTISDYNNSNNCEYTLTTVGTFSFGVRVKDSSNKTLEKEINKFNVIGFTGFSGGDGSQNDPYLISDISMFLEISKDINANYKLINNLDLSSFERISKFNGNFDGNGYTIKISLSEKNGIFDTISEKGTVKNIKINIGKTSDFLPTHFGSVCLSNYGQIINCFFTGSISTPSNVMFKLNSFGGIAADNYGTIDRCRNSASFSINKSTISSGYHFGGICGTNYNGIVKNCLVDGYQSILLQTYGSSIHRSYIGGVCGYSTGEYKNNIINCAINNYLKFGNFSDGDYGYNYCYGLISGNEYSTYDNGLSLAKELEGINGCIANKEYKLDIEYQYYGTGGGRNYNINTYNYSAMKKLTLKSSSEILDWWDNLLNTQPEISDPSSFEFSLSGKKFFLLNKEGVLNLSYRSASDGQVLNELKNIKWTNSNPDIATISGLDTGIADTDNNKVFVSATVNTLNVGATTIEGISPDGRKVSFTINIEPEIKSISDKTISKEIDLSVFTVTLNKPNKTYLQNFMNGIKKYHEFENGLSSFNVSDPTVRISDNGLSASIVYHISPQRGGNVTFVAESLNGQKANCIVNSVINKSLDLKWGKDNFSFENKIEDLPLIQTNNGNYSYNMDYSLFDHLDFSSSDILAMKNNLQPCGGVCFGMSVMAFKNATNQLDINSIEAGKSTLYQLSKPKNNGSETLKNGIGLYQASCASSKYQNARDKHIVLSTHDKLLSLYNKMINIESTGRPVILDYAWISDETKHNNNEENGVSAHAVLAYGIENNYAPYEINGKNYEYKIWIINPNNSFNLNTELSEASQYCMYIDENLSEFCIPVGGTRTDSQSYYSLVSTPDGEMNHLGDANLQFATDDYDLLPATTSDTGNNAIITVSNQAAVINGHLISGYKGNDSSIISRSFTPCGQNVNMNLTINKNNLPEVKAVSNNQKIGYISENSATYITVNKDCVVKFNDESINLKKSNGSYQIELAVNDSNFDDIIIKGANNQDELNVKISKQGLVISGENINNMTIETDTDSITLDTNEKSVVINEKNNKLVVLENVAIGDVNLDGVVDISDVTEIQIYLAKFIELSDIQKDVADTDGDSILSISDVTEIQKYLAKLVDHFLQPSGINLNTTSITLVVGNTQTLSANILPNDATNKTVSWFSSNNSIATVTYGVVTAKAQGTAIITAKTYNGKIAKCTVTVKQVEPISISLNKNSLSLYEGDTYQLSATISPSNATDQHLTWSSNNSSVISVDSNGKVTAKAIGSATITAKTTNGKTAECTIIVKDKWEGYTKIFTSADFNNIRNNLNGKFVLMNDIDLSSFGDWKPIGSRYDTFKGVLDGQNHSIKIAGLTDDGDGYGYYGLFTEIQGPGEVKNVTVNGSVTINSNKDIRCGIIAAHCSGTNLENCTNNVNLTINAEYSQNGYSSINVRAGGLIGSRSSYATMSEQISNCTNNGDIIIRSKGGSQCYIQAGGLIGSTNQGNGLNIINCQNNGKIEARALTYYYGVAIGGIVGTNYLDTIKISNCKNSGIVYSVIDNSFWMSQCSAGGIIGLSWNNNVQIEKCVSVDVKAECENGDSFTGAEIGYVGEFSKVFSYY